MKRVIFDHNVPARLARVLRTFDIKLARELGWDQFRNGELLQAAESNGFHVLLTADRAIPTENAISGRTIGLVCMSTNSWKILRAYVPAIADALHKCKPGQVLPVYCGAFTRRNAAKPHP